MAQLPLFLAQRAETSEQTAAGRVKVDVASHTHRCLQSLMPFVKDHLKGMAGVKTVMDKQLCMYPLKLHAPEKSLIIFL